MFPIPATRMVRLAAGRGSALRRQLLDFLGREEEAVAGLPQQAEIRAGVVLEHDRDEEVALEVLLDRLDHGRSCRRAPGRRRRPGARAEPDPVARLDEPAADPELLDGRSIVHEPPVLLVHGGPPPSARTSAARRAAASAARGRGLGALQQQPGALVRSRPSPAFPRRSGSGSAARASRRSRCRRTGRPGSPGRCCGIVVEDDRRREHRVPRAVVARQHRPGADVPAGLGGGLEQRPADRCRLTNSPPAVRRIVCARPSERSITSSRLARRAAAGRRAVGGSCTPRCRHRPRARRTRTGREADLALRAATCGPARSSAGGEARTRGERPSRAAADACRRSVTVALDRLMPRRARPLARACARTGGETAPSRRRAWSRPARRTRHSVCISHGSRPASARLYASG